ncbi:hypothetical protein CAEBREN_28957 [Caenorhabditis brenneri]|uniref:WW domain-containing protein n=1 Tax=Caenorhabditis brenneri TaxID=135651 RepID=G0PMP5_CAEBE|nr:hypothetical protein CAEBREN_28957 [Caenorhabditis brenneri]
MSHEDQENYDDYNGDQDNKYDQPYDEPNRGDDYGGRGRGFGGPPGGYGAGGPPYGMRGGRGGPGMAPPGFPGRGRGFAPPGMAGGFPPRGRGMPPGRGGFPPYRGGYSGAAVGYNYNGGPGAYGAQSQAPNPHDQEERLKRLAGCDEGQELWVETETAEGKKYFYHPVNRNTIWERPQNSKIINQPELAQLISRATEEEKNREDEEETFVKVASNSERKVERDFRDWQERRHDQLTDEFKEMLLETKIITHKSKKMMEEGEQHMKDILAVLENDKRWVRMTTMSASERDRMLEDHIDNLDRKGTPPPPTQQERDRRKL